MRGVGDELALCAQCALQPSGHLVERAGEGPLLPTCPPRARDARGPRRQARAVPSSDASGADSRRAITTAAKPIASTSAATSTSPSEADRTDIHVVDVLRDPHGPSPAAVVHDRDRGGQDVGVERGSCGAPPGTCVPTGPRRSPAAARAARRPGRRPRCRPGPPPGRRRSEPVRARPRPTAGPARPKPRRHAAPVGRSRSPPRGPPGCAPASTSESTRSRSARPSGMPNETIARSRT